jgi:hypothetical protein
MPCKALCLTCWTARDHQRHWKRPVACDIRQVGTHAIIDLALTPGHLHSFPNSAEKTLSDPWDGCCASRRRWSGSPRLRGGKQSQTRHGMNREFATGSLLSRPLPGLASLPTAKCQLRMEMSEKGDEAVGAGAILKRKKSLNEIEFAHAICLSNPCPDGVFQKNAWWFAWSRDVRSATALIPGSKSAQDACTHQQRTDQITTRSAMTSFSSPQICACGEYELPARVYDVHFRVRLLGDSDRGSGLRKKVEWKIQN